MPIIENHESFLNRFKLRMPDNDFRLLNLAYKQAKYGHRDEEGDQKRQSGERYFEHPRNVTLILADELNVTDVSILIPSMLHDIPEDSFILDFWDIEHIFGSETSEILKLLTKPKVKEEEKEEAYKKYFYDILHWGYKVILIKLADRLHNLRTLGACSKEDAEKKKEETKKYIIPMIQRLSFDLGGIANFFTKEISIFLK